MKIWLIGSFCCVLALGCAEDASVSPDGSATTAPAAPVGISDQARADALLRSAGEAYAESEERGFAWRQAGERLAAARASYDNADYAGALEEAQLALELAQASLAQADTEAEAWRTRAPFAR